MIAVAFYSDVWRSLEESPEDESHPANDPWNGEDGAVDYHSTFKLFGELVRSSISDDTAQDYIPDDENVLLSVLAIGLRQALRARSTHCKGLLEILANASRIRRWPKLFGTADQRPDRHGSIPRPEQPPDSILLVALDVLKGTDGPTSEDNLRNALRLINNCCQDDDDNRQTVLDHNGVCSLMSLAYRRVEPEFVVPALYNICVDHDPATHQLVHWTVGLTGTGARSDFEDSSLLPCPSESALQVLLGLADVLVQEERKSLLADLLELASLPVPQDLDRLPMEPSVVSNLDDGRTGLLKQLIRGPGSRLAASDTECRLAVCNTVINLLSHDVYRRNLIAGDLIRPFLSVAYPILPESLQANAKREENHEIDSNLLHCRQSVLKILYSVCAMPDFAAAYPLSTELAKDCLISVREPLPAKSEDGVECGRELLPPSVACVVLASLTQSEHIALALVSEHKIQERLSELLQSTDEQDVLYPTINFIGRLALPVANRSTLLEHGLLDAMHRFLTFDAAPNVQREAVITIRRLVTGSPQTLTIIRSQKQSQSTDGVARARELAAALALFRRADDRVLKLEIGRLAIETCRSLWSLANGAPEEAEAKFETTVGQPCRLAFADAIAFVVLHGENPGARGEGWFGFAMMSVWQIGRDLIVHCLNEDMLAEISRVVVEGSGPGYQNLRVVLAKMDAVPKDAVDLQTRSALEGDAELMGLARIWPN